MKKITVIIFTFLFAANFATAQGQQLKTFHHFEGNEDIAGLTYTGYEDELGNITRHGRFTYKKGTKSATLNYKNGKLDGEAIFLDTKPGINCKIKYKDGRWVEINYSQEKYQYYKYYDNYYGKLTQGPIILKCTRNEKNLPIGDFELTFIAPYEYVSIKGKFDNLGRSTGYWQALRPKYNNEELKKEDTHGCFDDFGSKVYFEQGYCLGNSESSISYGQQFIINKSISEQELRNKGFYYDSAPLYVRYQICNSNNQENSGNNIRNMLSDNLKSIKYHIYYNILDVSDKTTMGDLQSGKFVLGDIDDIDFSNAFVDGKLRGEPISYMSSELYQKLKADPSQLKFDENLKKYYIVKADGKSRLYVPLENETEFHSLWLQKQELEKRREKEEQDAAQMKRKKEISEKAISPIKYELDKMIKEKSFSIDYPNINKFRPILNYSIDSTCVSDSFEECMAEITVNTGKANGPYKSYKTSAVVLYDYPNWKIDDSRSFVKKEKVNNIWDYIESIKDSSKLLDKQLQSYKKDYPNIVATYNNEGISYKKQEDKPHVQYKYYTDAIGIQKEYLKFVDLVKQIDGASNNIILAAKEESDIVKTYQEVSKTWNLGVNGKISTEIKRLEAENYRTIQDSCLTFIELRKTIKQNNVKVAGYSKTAPTIVKAYNTYMKSVDLTWNQESGRNQAIREIINMQNELINALQKPNIGEIDTTVKKSKAKTWEEMKKSVLQ